MKKYFSGCFDKTLLLYIPIIKTKIIILIMKMILLKLLLIRIKMRQDPPILNYQEIISNVEGIRNNINPLKIKQLKVKKKLEILCCMKNLNKIKNFFQIKKKNKSSSKKLKKLKKRKELSQYRNLKLKKVILKK